MFLTCFDGQEKETETANAWEGPGAVFFFPAEALSAVAMAFQQLDAQRITSQLERSVAQRLEGAQMLSAWRARSAKKSATECE